MAAHRRRNKAGSAAEREVLHGLGSTVRRRCPQFSQAAPSTCGLQRTILPWGQVLSAVREPATWAMMIIGFGAVGTMVRTSRRRNAFSVA